ncbi:MAG: rhodanese-like domain-containing protein [Candidatus Rokubacteria bacterium]|nr:rhodanese-like domain-containing protein [Candidatus Rokubacteria bacterium]
MRTTVTALATAAVLLATAAPAAPPDHPVQYLKVAELKALLDRGQKVDIIDVRHWPEYEELHIKGARSMPLRAVPERAYEISRTGRVVFY